MKELHVRQAAPFGNLQQVDSLFEDEDKQAIDQLPWPQFPYKPVVHFSIIHDREHIAIRYEVREDHIRAVNKTVNSRVWEDSCVEFFISFNEGATYYNIECNCIGTVLVGYGKTGQPSAVLPTAIAEKIRAKAMLDETQKPVNWELTLLIPVSLFMYDDIHTLNGRTARANFYKCGDLLPTPHFLAWSMIESAAPNFHLPEFFGRLWFR